MWGFDKKTPDCNHIWIVKEKQILDSQFKKIFTDFSISGITLKSIPMGFFIEKVIVHYSCENCRTEKVELLLGDKDATSPN